MTDPVLSQEEVDALLQGMGGDAPAPAADDAPGTVREYDLANRELGLRGRMPAMEMIGERFARNIRTGLHDLIRRSPEVAIGGIQVQKFGTFLREIVVPTNFNLVSLRPLRGSGLIVCEPTLVFAIIDCLFGGAGRFRTRIEGRDFSPTEQRVIQRLLDVVIGEYRKAWSGVYALDVAYQRSEMLPQFVTVATPDEVVVSSSFTLEFGETSGTMHFCIPYASLEPIRDLLYASARGDPSDTDRRWVNVLKHQIQSAEVDLVAELATAPATIEQLLAFKPGDFIELDLQPLIEAKVDGVPVLGCHYGTRNGRYALRVDRLLTGPDAGWMGDPNHVR